MKQAKINIGKEYKYQKQKKRLYTLKCFIKAELFLKCPLLFLLLSAALHVLFIPSVLLPFLRFNSTTYFFLLFVIFFFFFTFSFKKDASAKDYTYHVAYFLSILKKQFRGFSTHHANAPARMLHSEVGSEHFSICCVSASSDLDARTCEMGSTCLFFFFLFSVDEENF